MAATSASTDSLSPSAEGHRRRLTADCERCFALCCVALPFAVSADFALDKAAGQPCPNLRADFRCGIHGQLRERGFRGCAVFDCFGAGQQVCQVTFAGQDWRANPQLARQMFDVFAVMRQLHELLWYLTEALGSPQAHPVHGELRRILARVEALTGGSADTLAELDLTGLRQQVGALLLRSSELVRAATVPGAASGAKPRGRAGGSYRNADLVGAKLGGSDLRAADLRGACLIAADVTAADLRAADLLGADLRDAELSGADLTGALFLTQAQIDAARGDTTTRLPSRLRRPPHWRRPTPR